MAFSIAMQLPPRTVRDVTAESCADCAVVG
jgi:hypothetical protein